MKQNILTYKSDGNGLKTVQKELEQVCEHVFYYTEPDKYGDMYVIIFEYKGVYFFVDRTLSEKLTKGITPEMYQNWIENNLSESAVLNPERYTRNLEIEVLRLAGADPEFLKRVMENKKAHVAAKDEAKRISREQNTAKELERKTQETIKELEQLEQSEIDYKEGKRINPYMFISLCQKYGVNIPIATKGRLMNKRKTESVCKTGPYSYIKFEGKRLQFFAGYFKVMNELNSLMNEQ